jgi:hypothetical protein
MYSGFDAAAYDEYNHYGLCKDALPWGLLYYCNQSIALKVSKSDHSPLYSWESVAGELGDIRWKLPKNAHVKTWSEEDQRCHLKG